MWKPFIMNNQNFKKILTVFVLGVVLYIFWVYLSETFFSSKVYVEKDYKNINIVYTPDQIQKILFDEGDN